VLRGAQLDNAQLTRANGHGTNLQGARYLTPKQLTTLLTNEETVLPDGTRGPYRAALVGRR